MELRFERALLPDGIARRVVVEVAADGRIARVEREAPASGGPFQPGLALPGMPNLHSHAFQRAMAGSAEVAAGAEGSFWGWRDVMYRFVDRLTPDDVVAITAFAHAEMLESGYTAVAEFHYLHHDRDGRPYAERATLAAAVRAAARTSGIRQLLLPCLYQQGHFDRRPLAAAQRRFHHATDEFLALVEDLARGDSARDRTGVAIHSLRAVPPEALAEVAVAARRAGWQVHIHVAEQAREVEDCLVAYQRRPVEYLLDGGQVDTRWCLVHATHVTSEELRGIAAAGAVVGLCPTTEANLGDGRFPLDEFLGGGGVFGIGSDSHVSIDPREELRTAEYNLRLWRERRVLAARPANPHVGSSLWHDAVAGGARALGYAAAGIAVGAPADLIRLETTRAEFAGLAPAALVDAWLFAPRPGALADVWVGGEAVVTAGRHRDRDALELAYRRSLARLVPEALA
ncbi:MAG: formimidoylglutamate deiminase [Proteobacteria bacterium]|nr:formimidoylglutamate deiminase [Pseudomonadota bacterium]